jgi:hypothetical protein
MTCSDNGCLIFLSFSLCVAGGSLPMLARGKVGMDYTPCFLCVSTITGISIWDLLTSSLIHRPFMFYHSWYRWNRSSAMSFNIPCALCTINCQFWINRKHLLTYRSFPPKVQVFFKMFSESVQLDS